METCKKRDEFLREIAALAVMTILSGALLAGSVKLWIDRPIVNSPGIYPTVVSAVMLVMSGYITVKTVKGYKSFMSGAELPAEEKPGLKRLITQEVPFRTFFTMCMTLLYVVGFHLIGFYISTAVFLLSTMLVFYKGKHVKRTVLITACTLILVYLIVDRLFGIHF